MRPSISRRILILSVTTTLVVVGAACAFVWVMMDRSLRAALDESLRGEARAFATRLENEHGRIEFEHGPATFESAGASLLIVFDEAGRLVFASPPLTDESAREAAAAQRRAQPDHAFFLSLPNDSREYRGLALYTPVADADEDEAPRRRPPADHAHAWIYVLRPTDALSETLRRLAGILLLAAGGAALAALLSGLFVARRGLAPVRAVAGAISRVDPARPRLTLAETTTPRELDPIIGTVTALLARISAELDRQRQLTADVAHDLRTPLAGIRALFDVCAQRPREPAEYADTIARAQAALRRLSELVDGLLMLARLDACADRPILADVSLRAVADAAIAAIRPLADARGVSITTDFAAPDALRCDREKLTKILSNLLANAVEHSPAGAAVEISSRAAGGALEFAVTDAGPGVPPQRRELIFDRFVRGDSARSTDGHHGLGLPIARGLANLLGGTVALDPAYSPGARFVVRLPGRIC